MAMENANLGRHAERFMVACNRPEKDLHWADDADEWVGKASLGQRHRLLLVRDLSWELFNVLALGLEGGAPLEEAIGLVEAMEAAAAEYASNTAGWSANVGLYFGAYGHASVNALHLH
eukprot:2505337-Prymnesium_polylepis.1